MKIRYKYFGNPSKCSLFSRIADVAEGDFFVYEQWGAGTQEAYKQKNAR